MTIQVTVSIDLGPLQRFQSALDSDLKGSAGGPVRQAFKQWAARYRAFLKERFSIFSRGGGNWAPLAPSTIARRRKGKGSKKFKKGSVAILIDTGTLYAALDPTFSGKPGALEKNIPFGIKVGYGGQGAYPDGVRIADIAAFHQHGGPRLPQRKIVVPPDQKTLVGMASDMKKAIAKMAKDAKG